MEADAGQRRGSGFVVPFPSRRVASFLGIGGRRTLKAECERLFEPIEEAAEYNPVFDSMRSHTALMTVASEAQMGLLRLQGWIQGLIDEATLSERLRLEAEANAWGEGS